MIEPGNYIQISYNIRNSIWSFNSYKASEIKASMIKTKQRKGRTALSLPLSIIWEKSYDN